MFSDTSVIGFHHRSRTVSGCHGNALAVVQLFRREGYVRLYSEGKFNVHNNV